MQSHGAVALSPLIGAAAKYRHCGGSASLPEGGGQRGEVEGGVQHTHTRIGSKSVPQIFQSDSVQSCRILAGRKYNSVRLKEA